MDNDKPAAGRFALEESDEGVCVFASGKRYALSCHPYEPCLYVTSEDGRTAAVHNAFEPLGVLQAFRAGKTVTSIRGTEYDEEDFCRMVEYAAGKGEIGIDEAEEIFRGRPRKKIRGRCPEDPFYALLAEYPARVVEYCIVEDSGEGPAAHRDALAAACGALLAKEGWRYDPDLARGKRVDPAIFFTAGDRGGKLTYRNAFLHPPHGADCTEKDFDRINAALFPNGTEDLEICEWTTDWSDYFDDGHEWWGALCATVYDRKRARYAVILASATD